VEDQVSIRDEQDLRDQLATALDDLAPGPLPLPAAMRQGRSIMIRKRVTIAIAAAVIVAAAAATPSVLNRLSRSVPPAVPTRYHVTVQPPGPGSPKGLIATVGIGGRRWKVTGSVDRAGMCISGFTGEACAADGPPRAYHTGDPASTQLGSGTRPFLQTGMVRADITYLRLSLRNGQVLTLRPVPVFGPAHAAIFAFAVPAPQVVTEISAYSRHGLVGYAVPFTALGSVEPVRWLRPGQPALPRPARYRIGSGNLGGTPWSEYLYIGPWGACMGGAGGGSDCWADGVSRAARVKVVELLGASWGSGYGAFVPMAVAPAVSYVLVSPAHGAAFRIRPSRADGARFAVFAVPSGSGTTRWAAYSASGQRLASGRVPT
jgi:hypothetical protein